MSAGRRGAPQPSRAGRAAAVLGLLALSVLGFGAGLAAGVLFEEPTLVASYLRGETVSVEWAAGPEAPAVAAAPPEEASPGDRAPASADDTARPAPARRVPPVPAPPRVAKVPSPAPGPPPAARAAPRGFAVQVGAFSAERAAGRLAESLRAKGHPVYVIRAEGGAGAPWRVRVGPLASRPEAERAAARLRSREKLPTWILEEAG